MPPRVHCPHSFISFNYHGKLALKPESQLKQLILKQPHEGGRGAHLVALTHLLSFIHGIVLEGGNASAFDITCSGSPCIKEGKCLLTLRATSRRRSNDE